MSALYVVGVDMGATNTAFGIVDARGTILFQDNIPTGNYSTGEEYAKVLSTAIKGLVTKNNLNGEIKAIGIGAPNGNMHAGAIENAVNISWANGIVVPLAKMITEETDLPCRLTNDANAAAFGEMVYGVAKGMKDFIMITLGTGVGSGIVANGSLVIGHDGMAGELGHMIVVRRNGRPCGCGRNGCLEAYASATGVARTAREYLELNPGRYSLLREIVHRPLTSKDVFEAAEKRDELAIEVFNFTGKILGETFCDFITFSSPQAIILFGGLSHASDYLLDPLQKAIDDNVMKAFAGKTRILLSQLKGAEAAILGASALAWE
ncbi:MAG: ROK family protein [Candidatus Azobacteroides pseudotrichonymphae]|jgi:glucokinase|uniref:Glucokinase n=1 Tax=Azobacteroides pseudotrichonymphae genomovar. CFP2 TaxID=511995 RepID=B6YQW6_AZOPC|nr:ROK family protein [Candidatus Azobacteroides pseudotrichonymphae]BAG83588.1 glucokinase [Candidatus Azobacteroides pseudotrichonymphae genomovar. CFP2]GMO32482.1 MAG: ROK family protein [Candidatus Azobacteroides pseudotrichonymphae]